MLRIIKMFVYLKLIYIFINVNLTLTEIPNQKQNNLK